MIMTNTVAIIPARGGSRSIPHKNIKEFAGKPLIYWAVRAANNANTIGKVIVSTDSPKIKKVVEDFRFNKVMVVGRSREASSDKATSETVLLEITKKFRFSELIFLQATNPFVKSRDIDNAYRLYKKRKYDSLLSAVPQKRFLWDNSRSGASPLNYDYKERPRRQDFKRSFVENGALYITSRKSLIESENRLSGKIGIYPMQAYSYFELDEPSDWKLAEALFLKEELYLKDGLALKNIRLLVLDVDGVLTDGGVYYTKDGERMVKFSRIDGKGITELLKEGRRLLVISAEESKIAAVRVRKLKLKDYHFGVRDKWRVLKRYLDANRISLDQTAFIGDDIQDLGLIKKSGFSACPCDANKEVKLKADYVCKRGGGRGAIREVADIILSRR